jgi:hypothetical protein
LESRDAIISTNRSECHVTIVFNALNFWTGDDMAMEMSKMLQESGENHITVSNAILDVESIPIIRKF